LKLPASWMMAWEDWMRANVWSSTTYWTSTYWGVNSYYSYASWISFANLNNWGSAWWPSVESSDVNYALPIRCFKN
jgi:hypothetical protein